MNIVNTIRKIVAVGIGAAVFMILGRFGSIPTGIPNTSIETAYAFLALMALMFGPVVGLLIGLIGHGLKDLVFYGAPWFSWVIASGVVGLVIGMAFRSIRIKSGDFGKKEAIKFNIYQILANVLAWGIIAPYLDVVLYAEPGLKVLLQGITAAICNSITVGVLGTYIISTYSKTRIKSGSLRKES